MTVKNILGECLVKMGMQDFTSKQSYSEAEQEILNALVAALNIVYRDIVAHYLPLTEEEDVEFVNGAVKLSAFSKRILYPVCVTYNGERMSFKVHADKITAGFSGSARVEYAYMPGTPLSIGSSLNDLRLTSGILCDGTLGEYYFENKMFDLAKNFDTSYRDKLGQLRYKGKRLRLRLRGWQS